MMAILARIGLGGVGLKGAATLIVTLLAFKPFPKTA